MILTTARRRFDRGDDVRGGKLKCNAHYLIRSLKEKTLIMFKTHFRSRRLSFFASALVAISLLAAPYALIHAQKSKPSKQADSGKAADTLENAT